MPPVDQIPVLRSSSTAGAGDRLSHSRVTQYRGPLEPDLPVQHSADSAPRASLGNQPKPVSSKQGPKASLCVAFTCVPVRIADTTSPSMIFYEIAIYPPASLRSFIRIPQVGTSQIDPAPTLTTPMVSRTRLDKTATPR